MHIVSEHEWQAHRAEVSDLRLSVVSLATAIQALAPHLAGVKAMSTATTAALAKLDVLEAKVDRLIADKQDAAAAALAADEADTVKIEEQTDRIAAKIDSITAPAA